MRLWGISPCLGSFKGRVLSWVRVDDARMTSEHFPPHHLDMWAVVCSKKINWRVVHCQMSNDHTDWSSNCKMEVASNERRPNCWFAHRHPVIYFLSSANVIATAVPSCCAISETWQCSTTWGYKAAMESTSDLHFRAAICNPKSLFSVEILALHLTCDWDCVILMCFMPLDPLQSVKRLNPKVDRRFLHVSSWKIPSDPKHAGS